MASIEYFPMWSASSLLRTADNQFILHVPIAAGGCQVGVASSAAIWWCLMELELEPLIPLSRWFIKL